MKKFMKWTGIVLGGLIGLALLAGAALYLSGCSFNDSRVVLKTYLNTNLQ
jgi:hypothetical protein